MGRGERGEKQDATPLELLRERKPWLTPFHDSATAGACHEFIIVTFPTVPRSTACRAPQSVVENSRVPRLNTYVSFQPPLLTLPKACRTMRRRRDIPISLTRLISLYQNYYLSLDWKVSGKIGLNMLFVVFFGIICERVENVDAE